MTIKTLAVFTANLNQEAVNDVMGLVADLWYTLDKTILADVEDEIEEAKVITGKIASLVGFDFTRVEEKYRYKRLFNEEITEYLAPIKKVEG